MIDDGVPHLTYYFSILRFGEIKAHSEHLDKEIEFEEKERSLLQENDLLE